MLRHGLLVVVDFEAFAGRLLRLHLPLETVSKTLNIGLGALAHRHGPLIHMFALPDVVEPILRRVQLTLVHVAYFF